MISCVMSNSVTTCINEEILCSVMSTILYFDIFNHPLTREEIGEYAHNCSLNDNELDQAIEFLITNSLLFEKNGYYLPHQKYENIVRRDRGNALAKNSWPQAISKSILISKFPFVRSVVVSGSLSKGYMDEKSDIDFLIITQPGRLWLTRSILAIYKKIFLLNSHKFFCVNYFLDYDNLMLPDKNVFIATELLFAVPVYNPEMHHRFVEVNDWSKKYYPSIKIKSLDDVQIPPDTSTKLMLEKIFSGWLGGILDRSLKKLTVGFWQKKFKTMNRAQYNRDMKSTDGVSKHHPNGFRDRVLEQHEKQVATYKNKIHLALNTADFSHRSN